MEVIDAARDNLDEDKMEKEAGIVDADVSSDSDTSGDSEDDTSTLPDGSVNDKQGPVDQIQDYRKKAKGLHRQHRGIMQFKVSLCKICCLTIANRF